MKILNKLILTLALSVFVPLFSAANTTADHLDGNSIESNNISVNMDSENNRLSLHVQTQSNSGNILILISDAFGNIVYRETTNIHGPLKFDIPLDHWISGDYLVRIKGASLSYSGRFKKD